MKFSTFNRLSGGDIIVNPNNLTYLRELTKGRTILHFMDGTEDVVELPIWNVKTDLEASLKW